MTAGLDIIQSLGKGKVLEMVYKNWEWSSSFHASDSRQTTYCCFFPHPDGSYGFRAFYDHSDIPWEARRALAERVRLDVDDFSDWAELCGSRAVTGGTEVSVSVRRCWRTSGQWKWTADRTRQEYRIYKSYLGETLSGALFRKLNGNSFDLDDIDTEGKRRLAEAVNLDEYEIDAWCEVEKVEATTDSFLIYVAIPLVWLNAPRRDDWDWREDDYNADQSLAYYTCRGAAVCRDLMNTVVNGIELKGLVPASAWNALAEKVGLDATQQEQWAQEFSYIASEEGLSVHVAVPNVWICADLLQGGDWWDVGVVNWGGVFGQTVSYLGTWKKKEIYCYNTNELIETLNEHRKCIWGLISRS